MSVWRLVCIQFILLVLTCASALYLIIGAGQIAQLARIVGGLSYLDDWALLLVHALIVLSEVVLPLACLFAATILFARLRAEGAATGLSCAGVRPTSLLLPLAACSLGVAVTVSALAHLAVPESVSALSNLVQRAAGQRLLGDALSDGRLEVRREFGANSQEVYWASLERPDSPALLIRGESPRLRVGEESSIQVDRLEVWSPEYHLNVAEVSLRLDQETVTRRLRMFGPPNSVISPELDVHDRHHIFTKSRRTAVPLMAIPWSVLGASLGLLFGGVVATIVCGGAVALGYWVLRTGELAARAQEMDPTIAAWLPLVLTILLAFGVLRVLDRSRVH